MAEGTISLDFSLGGQDIKSAVGALKERIREASLRALRDVAEELLLDTRPFVPILTGALMDSGRVEVIRDPANVVDEVRVVYGGKQRGVLYAIKQHEEEYRHPTLDASGSRFAAKYIERPFKRNTPFYLLLYTAQFEFYFSQLGG